MDSQVYGRRWSSEQPADLGTVLEYSAVSHVGLVRSINEDSYLAGPPVFAVADGMGGHSRGDVASGMVVDALSRLAGTETVAADDLERAIAHSRERIAGLGASEHSPGSTVVTAAHVMESDRSYWLVAHVGDSRAYVWRRGALQAVTRDHSVVQELVDAGELAPEAARMHPERHVITRAVGALSDAQPEFTWVPLEPGTRLLLCSDGLTTELSEESINVLLSRAAHSGEAVDLLVQAAVEAGGHDNVTVVVVDVLSVADADGTPHTAAQVLEDTAPHALRCT